MFKIWNENGGDHVNEQRLADQVRQMRTKSWLTEAEVDEITKACELERLEIVEETLKGQEGMNHVTTIDDVIPDKETMDKNNHDVDQENTENDEVIEELNKEKRRILNRILERLRLEAINPPMNLRNLDRNKVRSKAKEINKIHNIYHQPTSQKRLEYCLLQRPK